MGKLIYAINTSLDGFTEDTDGSFDWSVPGEDVHEFYNDLIRGVGTQLLGRRLAGGALTGCARRRKAGPPDQSAAGVRTPNR